MLRFKARRLDPTKRETLTPSQARFMRSIIRMWAQVREEVIANERDFIDAILHRTPTLMISLMPTEPLLEAQNLFYEELLAEVLDGGSRVLMPSLKKATVKFSFDRTRPEAASWANNNAGSLISNFNREQEAVLRDLISRASMGNMTVDSVARELRNSIGLTSQQSEWVENRWQREFAARIRDGWNPRDAEALADQASERYYQQVLRYRAETISRTEILTASHEGRREAWAQGIEGGWIDADWDQQWDAADDACDICEPFDGMRAPVAEGFPDGEPPLHPNCRCDVVLVPPDVPESIRNLSDEDLDNLLAQLIEDM